MNSESITPSAKSTPLKEGPSGGAEDHKQSGAGCGRAGLARVCLLRAKVAHGVDVGCLILLLVCYIQKPTHPGGLGWGAASAPVRRLKSAHLPALPPAALFFEAPALHPQRAFLLSLRCFALDFVVVFLSPAGAAAAAARGSGLPGVGLPPRSRWFAYASSSAFFSASRMCCGFSLDQKASQNSGDASPSLMARATSAIAKPLYRPADWGARSASQRGAVSPRAQHQHRMHAPPRAGASHLVHELGEPVAAHHDWQRGEHQRQLGPLLPAVLCKQLGADAELLPRHGLLRGRGGEAGARARRRPSDNGGGARSDARCDTVIR